LIRAFLTTLLLLVALWAATFAVLPTGATGSRRPPDPIWRRTDQGWIRAETWLSPHRDASYQPEPPIYPIAALPLIVVCAVCVLIIEQQPPKER